MLLEVTICYKLLRFSNRNIPEVNRNVFDAFLFTQVMLP